MALTQRLPDGRLVVLDGDRWRLASDQEEAGSQSSRGETVAMQLLANAGGYARLAGRIGGFLGSGMPNLRGGTRSTDLSQQLQAKGGALEESLAPLATVQPGAAAAGRIWTDPANLAGLTGAGRAVVRRRMAERVQADITQQGARVRAGPAAPEVGPAPAEAPPAAPGVAAEAPRPRSGPMGLYDDVRAAVQQFTSPEDLTPDQRLMLPVGEQLGFQFLPGQARGAVGIRRLAGSDPLIESAFAPELQANLRGVRRSAARSVGLPVDDFSRNLLGQAADDIGAGIEEVGSRVGSINLHQELQAGIETIRKTEPFLSIPESGALTGREALQLRSTLNAASRTAWKQGANAPANKAEYIDNLIDQLDDLIEAQLSPEDVAEWAKLRERWKNLKVLESPNVVNELGDINVRSLATQLRKYYKGAYGRQVTGADGRRAGLQPETREFMDWSRLGAQFGDNFPNSGTASRTRLVQLMTQPTELAKSLALRAALKAQDR